MVDKKDELKGFVRNDGKTAVFKVQRSLPPSAKVTLESLYLALGKKSGLERGPEFVCWVRENVFPGPDWGFYNTDGTPFFSEKKGKVEDVAPEAPPAVAVKPAEGAGLVVKKKNSQPKVGEITPVKILEAEVGTAELLIEECHDKTVIRKAINLANHLANKEEHRRHLLRRLEQI